MPVSAEQPGESLADEDGVLGDHDAHGSSAVMRVGPPGGLLIVRRPSTAATRAASPASPAPAGSAFPIPSSLDGDDDGGQASPRTPTGSLGGAGVLGDVGEGLGHDEVGDGLDGRRRPAGQVDVDRDGDWAEGRQGGQRGIEAAVGQDRGMHAAHEAAQLGQGGHGLAVGLVDQHPGGGGILGVEARLRPGQLHRHGHQALLRAVVQVALDPAALGLGGVDDLGPAVLKLADAVGEDWRRPGPRTRRVQLARTLAEPRVAQGAASSSSTPPTHTCQRSATPCTGRLPS